MDSNLKPIGRRARFIAPLVTAITIAASALSGAAHAAPFDPIVELFRLGAGDRLLIDRGGPVDLAGDVNGDGLDDLLIGAGVGGIRVVFGPTNGNNGVLNGQQLNGVIGFNISHDSVNISYVSAAGDINADGLDDIMVGSLGGVHIIYGSRDRYPTIFDVSTLDGTNGFSINASVESISDAGDVNNDGIDDIIFGNPNATINDLPGVGAAYVLYGRSTPFPSQIEIDSIRGSNGFAIIGKQQQDRFGKFVGAAGDFNHDGVDDLMIGAPNKTIGVKPEVGEAYVVYGQPAGHPDTISVADLTDRTGLVVVGVDNQDSMGGSVSGIGDLNHDGIDDIAIGAPGKGPFGTPTDYPGEVMILFGGKFNGVASIDRRDLNGDNGVRVRGIRGGVIPIEENETIWGDLAGTSLDGIGDFNGDGMDDLLIGASHSVINPRRKGVGQTYVIYGSQSAFPARLALSDLDGSNGFRINGVGTVDYYGVYTRAAGDFNDDGINDFISGASGEGASYVIYGRNFGFGRVPSPGTPSMGAAPPVMPEAARVVGGNLPPLRFNELADPTGPTPIPVGVSTDVNDPATPGFIPPNLFEPVAVLRPEDVVVPEPATEPLVEPTANPVVDGGSVPVTVTDTGTNPASEAPVVVTTPTAVEVAPSPVPAQPSNDSAPGGTVTADVSTNLSSGSISVGGGGRLAALELLLIFGLLALRTVTRPTKKTRLLDKS